FVDLLHVEAREERALDLEDALGRRLPQCCTKCLGGGVRQAIIIQLVCGCPAGASVLECAKSLLERLLERAPDCHGLTHRLHLGGQTRVRSRELLEGEPRALHHHVVQHGLKGGRRGTRYVVGNLVQRVTNCQLGPDTRNGKSGCLGRQCRRTRNARIHLDHQQVAVLRAYSKLDIAATSLHSDLANHLRGGVSDYLVLASGARHRRRHGNGVTGVHTHWIDVLDGAHDPHVVRVIAHHLQLELLPAEHTLLDEHLAYRRLREAAPHDCLELIPVVRHTTACSAQRERRPDDGRKAGFRRNVQRSLPACRYTTLRNLKSDPLHRLREQRTILGHLDSTLLGADKLHSVLLQNAILGKRQS